MFRGPSKRDFKYGATLSWSLINGEISMVFQIPKKRRRRRRFPLPSARAARRREAENSRASRSKTGSLQLVCKSEPNADQLEYGTWGALVRSA